MLTKLQKNGLIVMILWKSKITDMNLKMKNSIKIQLLRYGKNDCFKI
jgi:hypothetical protein